MGFLAAVWIAMLTGFLAVCLGGLLVAEVIPSEAAIVIGVITGSISGGMIMGLFLREGR